MSHPRVFVVETEVMTSIAIYTGNYGTLTQKRDSFAYEWNTVDFGRETVAIVLKSTGVRYPS